MAISSFGARFTTTTALSLAGTDITVTAQLYEAKETNVFSPIDDTLINLTPTLSGTVPIGTVLKSSKNMIVRSVAQDSALMLVFSAKASGLSPISTITGYASAGMIIF